MAEKLTPVRKQYLEIKRKYPGAILFFRLGDFYETFDEDAHIASKELDIVLTSRNVAKGTRIPMAGIPHHAAESYIARLIEKGYHVAICEQVGEGPVKGLFPREVVRVITPGTVLEPELLKGDGNNYLLALITMEDKVGLAFADVSTGEFSAGQFESDDLRSLIQSELARLAPAEVLAPDSLPLDGLWEGNLTPIPDWRFAPDRAEARLMDHFGAATLDGFGLGDAPLAVRAAGVLIEYLAESQQAALPLLTSLSRYSLDDFMLLDAATRRNLELMGPLRGGEAKGSLLGVMDKTVTAMGRRLLRQWLGKPLLSVERIERRLDQVEAFAEHGMARAEIRDALKDIGDLERISNRIAAHAAGPRDLVALRSILRQIPGVQAILKDAELPVLQPMLDSIDACSDVCELLERAITDEPPATLANMGIIRPGFSKALDNVIEESRHAREWISSLEQVERERTGIKSLKVGYNKVFGYYIEVTNTNADLVPEEYIRKQTLVNAERYITPEMKEYESRVLSAEERIRALESEIFHEVCREVAANAERLLTTARALGRLDVLAGLAEVAIEKGYTRPRLLENQSLAIRGGRHPVVEEMIASGRFVPNDAIFKEGERIRVITGPNMSGKSTYLRQVALIALMAQMGSFVPAESAEIGLVDRIFTRIGAQDEIFAGQSTFMVEMVETANILHNATSRSLLILDEIGRGTSTYDGVAIAWAVVEYIHNHPRLRARTLFATHYHELTDLADSLPGVRNYNVAVSEERGEVVFLHKITPGGADKSYGIHVAELAGLPRPVINRAQEILAQFETELGQGRQKGEPSPQQLRLFIERHPLLDELETLDLDALSPLEALNRLYEWKQRYAREAGV